MGKKRALAHICEVLSKPETRDICSRLEFQPEDMELVLERFCDGKNVEQCAMSPDRQRRRVPILETLFVSWLIDNMEAMPEHKKALLRGKLRET